MHLSRLVACRRFGHPRPEVRQPRRHLALEAPGRVLVSTDVHGNLEDFERLRAIFEAMRADDPGARWVILGDIVHGPDEESAARFPELYGYPDRSRQIVAQLAELIAGAPEQVWLVLGNHDHAHIGGPITRKFHHDEPGHLEATMTEAEREQMRALFRDALLLVTTSCGVALTHGSPARCISAPEDLDGIELPATADSDRALVMALTTPYGQRKEDSLKFLAAASRGGHEQRVLLHGHDRDEGGWFVEAETQACPVIFGARREHKRYVVLDLAARYAGVQALREDIEVRRLYGASTVVSGARP